MKNKNKILTVILLVISLLSTTSVAYAGNGNGGGNGSGGGKSEALAVESSSIENGATVNPEDTITLTFTKNVVNSSVKDTNMTLFSLTDKDGNEIAINVNMADDQVEPDKKNDIQIVPQSPLSAGEYTLTAKAGITSKSENVMKEDYILTFNVKAEEQASTDVTTDSSTEVSTESSSKNNLPTIIGVVLVIVIAVIYAFTTKRNKK